MYFKLCDKTNTRYFPSFIGLISTISTSKLRVSRTIKERASYYAQEWHAYSLGNTEGDKWVHVLWIHIVALNPIHKFIVIIIIFFKANSTENWLLFFNLLSLFNYLAFSWLGDSFCRGTLYFFVEKNFSCVSLLLFSGIFLLIYTVTLLQTQSIEDGNSTYFKNVLTPGKKNDTDIFTARKTLLSIIDKLSALVAHCKDVTTINAAKPHIQTANTVVKLLPWSDFISDSTQRP